MVRGDVVTPAGIGRLAAAGLLLVLAGPGCGGPPTAPAHPTWADVEPILRAECTQCHGGSAAATGSSGSIAYRFDFFDVRPEVCGEAAEAVDLDSPFAAARSSLIANAITTTDPDVRPPMPPAPAVPLAAWEWQTLLRWTDDPQRGVAPAGNRPPAIRVLAGGGVVDKNLALTVLIDDPDGQSVVGVLGIGDARFKMDRPGSFSVGLDSSAWPAGEIPLRAVLCDGWINASYALPAIEVRHSPAR